MLSLHWHPKHVSILKISGEVNIEIDYKKTDQDAVWDGLKGYITNPKLTDKQVIENYDNL